MVKYTNYIEKRRYALLRIFLFAMAAIVGIFSVINLKRGLFFLSFVEIVVFVVCIVLLWLIRNPKYLRISILIYIFMILSFGLIAFASPKTHVTIFAWPLIGILATFFLTGKRLGSIISAPFLIAVIGIFFNKYGFGPDALPTGALCNIILFTISASAIVMFYETTRFETEKALIEDIEERTKTEKENKELIARLQAALSEIKTLGGLLPICANCKKIRDDKGYWNNLEAYIEKHSDASFSHGICQECSDELYGNEEWYIEMKKE
jgi:hypothetical protein